jgi:hypothetical protein
MAPTNLYICPDISGKNMDQKVSTINKFRDITNTLSMALCPFRDDTNPTLQG